MSAAIEDEVVVSVLTKANAAQRDFMIQQLLLQAEVESATQPIALRKSSGEVIGVFVPNYRSSKKAPPKMTPEFEEEISRRLRTPEDSVDMDEFIRLVKAEDDRLSKQ